MATRKSNKKMVADQITATDENLKKLEKGSQERQVEARILKEQIETQIALEKAESEIKLNELKAKAEIEYNSNKLEADKEQNKKENLINWVKIGVGAFGTLLYAGMGWLKMKENMTQGKEIGSDAEPWWKEIIRK